MSDYCTDWAVSAPSSLRHRLIVGGACWDHFLTLTDLVLGGKNDVRQRVKLPGGGALNNALVHRALAPDVPVALLAAVGADEDGAALYRHLARYEIAVPWVPVPGERTSASYVLAHDGRGTSLTDRAVRELALPPALLERHLLGAAACCLVAPANDQLAPVLASAARHRVPVFLGLGTAQVQRLGYRELANRLVGPLELVVCNRAEARALTGTSDVGEQLSALSFAGRARVAVVTDGAAGLHALADGAQLHVGAYADGRTIVDDVGAGDAAQGAIVDALLRGHSLDAALAAGARQGYEACLAPGATTRLLGEAQMRDYLAATVAA